MLHRYLACSRAGHKIVLWNFYWVCLFQLSQAVNYLIKRKRVRVVEIEIGNVCCLLGRQVSIEAVLGQVYDHTLLLLHFCNQGSKS